MNKKTLTLTDKRTRTKKSGTTTFASMLAVLVIAIIISVPLATTKYALALVLDQQR